MIDAVAPRWASSSLHLSGSAYVDCGTPAVLSNVSSFTLEAWVYLSDVEGFQSVLGNVDNATGGQYQVFLSDGYPTAYVGIAPYVIQARDPLPVETWHHLASTFDGGTGTLTLYVNGVQAAQQTFSGTLPAGGTNVLLGAVMQANQPTWFLQGQLGRAMIWNAVRSREDILKDSVHLDVYRSTVEPNLVFDVDFATLPAIDGSGNGIELTHHATEFFFNTPCVEIQGSGYVDAGNLAAFSRPGTEPFTIEGWFYPEVAQEGTLLSFGKDGDWEYQVVYRNNQIVGRRNADALEIASNDVVLPANSYYHFALTYEDTTKALSLYVNGNLQEVDYFPTPVTAVPGGSLWIGAQAGPSGTATSPFQGAIQNVRLWNVCLDQATVFQWMYNNVVTDERLIVNCDFSVSPPNDSTDSTTLTLEGTAVQKVLHITVPTGSHEAKLGVPKSLNAQYFNSTTEVPDPPPPLAAEAVADQPELFSEEHFEASWAHLVERLGLAEGGAGAEASGRFREQFEEAFARAQEMMEADPRLRQVVTRTDERGMTRIVYHGVHGDMLVYEGAIGAESDCVLWWITFIYQLTVGFLGAIGLVPTPGKIATRIYNLVKANARAWAAVNSLIGRTITASAAIGVVGVIYAEGLMWPVIKFALTTAGWYALFWVLKKVIAIVTGLEAAEILAGFIVWAGQLVLTATRYNGACGSSLTDGPAALSPAYA